MDPLRWKYNIQVDVEETASHAWSKTFSVRYLEGQSRTGHVYPLNQIEIEGGDLASNVRVVVSSHVTQVYFFIDDVPDMEELETIVWNLGEAEQILNEVVIFAPNETARFSIETEVPVLSVSMLMTREKLVAERNKVLDKLREIILNQILLASVDFTCGKITYAKMRIDTLLNELTSMERGLIQMAKEQGIKEAEKWESELDKLALQSKRFEAELVLAQTPTEIGKILKRFLRDSLASNQTS